MQPTKVSMKTRIVLFPFVSCTLASFRGPHQTEEKERERERDRERERQGEREEKEIVKAVEEGGKTHQAPRHGF